MTKFLQIGFIFISCLICSNLGAKATHLVGGWTEKNLTDPYVREIANFAFERLEKGCNCLYRHKLLNIVKAKQQVVSGLKTLVILDLVQTGCRQGEDNNIEECEAVSDKPTKTCKVVVWDKPWQKFRQVLSSSCEEHDLGKVRRKRYVVLGKDDHDYVHMGLFKNFMTKYNKTYQTKKEFKYRYEVFRMNQKKVRELQNGEQGTATYGITFFSDYTQKEFKHYFTGLKPESKTPNRRVPLAKIPNVELPTSFDWRDHKVVTPVKNQGMCGSCWAFSTTGNIEGQWALAKGELVSLSEQELVDCDVLDSGCNGGLMTNAFEEIVQLGGLEGEKDYPYEGRDDKCQMKKPLVRASISSYVNISTNETEMAQWLLKNGPIAIGINANAMQFYMGGISHPWKFLCRPDTIDHGVLIVGFGESHNRFFNKTTPYWTIKNSWGARWGEQGYYRVYRGDGTCGLNTMASSAIVG